MLSDVSPALWWSYVHKRTDDFSVVIRVSVGVELKWPKITKWLSALVSCLSIELCGIRLLYLYLYGYPVSSKCLVSVDVRSGLPK
jgi:hypothetical protein